MTDILIGNGTVVTLGTQNQLIEQGAVLVQDGRIAAIDKDATLRQQYPDAEFTRCERRFDYAWFSLHPYAFLWRVCAWHGYSRRTTAQLP